MSENNLCWSLKKYMNQYPKGNQSWIFIGRTDAEAETLILWPAYKKSWLIWKDPDNGKDWRREEKGMTENEMVGWHHRLNGHEFGWTPAVGDGQGGLACCNSWGRRVGHDWATELNWDCSLPGFSIREGVSPGKNTGVYWPIVVDIPS